MIAIFARLFAVLLAVTALSLIVVALSPRAQADNGAGALDCRAPSAAADCAPADRTGPARADDPPR